jgi:hypothetical protein
MIVFFSFGLFTYFQRFYDSTLTQFSIVGAFLYNILPTWSLYWYVFSTTTKHRPDNAERYGDVQHRIVTDDEPFGGT